MNQYICFYRNYKDFVHGVKYRIHDIVDGYYIVKNYKIPISKDKLFYVGDIVNG